jgi:hypothetical protein
MIGVQIHQWRDDMTRAKSLALLAALTLAAATATQASPFKTEEKEKAYPGANAPATSTPYTAEHADFRFVPGDTGWELKQHVYVRSGRSWVHSEECDHAIRTARAPAREEIDTARNLSPG